MLRTKSIKSERQPVDGLRISVMSRHTLNDGQTPDPEITDDLYDDHWPALAAPLPLIGAYVRREITWSQYELEYRKHLKDRSTATKVLDLVDLALAGTVTILCIEDEPTHCHRRLLAEECLELQPELEVYIA